MSDLNKEKIENFFYKAFEAHSDELFRFCSFKVSDRDLSQDLVQKAFERLWLSLSKGNEVVNPRAYLFKTLKFLIIDEYRSSKNTVSLELLQEQGYETSVESEVGKVATQMEFERVREKMKQLPPKYEEVLVLRYVNEFSLKEIASTLNLKENLISVRLNRAVKQLEQLIKY